jgi:DNA-binding NarL/FixJ family response regulator
MSLGVKRTHSILILHSEPIVAAGLGAALKEIPEFDVTVGRGEPDAERRASPDVVVSDHEQGIQLASKLHSGQMREAPRVGVVVLAATPREFAVQNALDQGVLGYLVTGCGLDELIRAVRAAASGERFLCHAAARQFANSIMNESLTSRERDVLKLLAIGYCNKTIAIELAIASGTVKAHVKGIMSKLNAASRTEAASIAAHRGLLDDALEVAGMR